MRTNGAVSWALLGTDGAVEKGRDIKPPKGWFNRVRAAIGVALLVNGYPPVYAVHPVCANDVEVSTAGEHARFWGVAPSPGALVWLFPDASKIGIGADTSEVERLVLAFQGKLGAEGVASGPDQRGGA